MQAITPSETPAAGALERRLDLNVSIADLEKDVELRLKQMAGSVKLPGFRPGKVPLSVIKQHYGNRTRSEALSDVIDRVFGDAIQTQNIRVAGLPRIEPRQSEDSQNFAFTAIFEIYPEFSLGDISTEIIEQPQIEVTSAEIDKTIEILRKQRSRFETTDRPAANGDQVTIDFLGKKDGVPFEGGEAKDFPLIMGEGRLLPDFETAIDGLKTGEDKTFDITFPDDYAAKDLAGQTVQFTITVKNVEAPVLPEVDAEFASSLGIQTGDIGQMRTEIESNLKREVKRRLNTRIKDQAMNTLAKANPIEVPNALIELEIERLMEASRKDMEARGMKIKDMPIQREWFTESAKRRVLLGLVMVELIKNAELRPTAEEVRAKVEEGAQGYENPDEVVRWYYAEKGRLADVEAVVLEDNVVKWVLSHAKVVDKPITFDELMSDDTA